MSSSPVTSRPSRARKGSLKEANKDTGNVDLSLLIRESEERIKSFFREEMKNINNRLLNIENNMSNLKMNCVRLDEEIVQIKEVLAKQHARIENHEEKLRENNLVIHNIPERDVAFGSTTLKTDDSKITYLCETSRVDVSAKDIVSVHRLGQRKGDRPRPLKVVLKSKDLKYKLLNKRKEISKNHDLIQPFGNNVFVNPDHSFLYRKEDFRLRKEMKRLKSENPDSSVYLRSGSLYQDNIVIDKVNITNQLF